MGVDSSLTHADYRDNNCLMLDEGPNCEINGRFDSPEKKFNVNFSNTNTQFCLSLHYNHEKSYLFVKAKDIFKSKADNKNVNFTTQFCLGSSLSNSCWHVAITKANADVY